MKRYLLIILLLILSVTAYADEPNLTPVEIPPLSGKVSFSTVTFTGVNWHTAPSVEMRGRKEIIIQNPSLTANVYISGQSGSTATTPTYYYGTLYPRRTARFKASSDLHIYVSGNTAGNTCEIWEIR